MSYMKCFLSTGPDRPFCFLGRKSGFTLIEMIIAVAALAILTTLSISFYTSHILDANRTEAKSALRENALFLEQQASLRGSYLKPNGKKFDLPIKTLPRQGGQRSYRISSNVTATTFTLIASPVGRQKKDKCSTLRLTHTGSTRPTTAGCW